MSSTLQCLLNEIYKGLLISWHYRFNMINEFIALGINFTGTVFLMNAGNTDLSAFGPSLVGFIVWVYASYILNVSYTHIMLEGRSGTLEQMYMSPVSPVIVFLGATLSTIIAATAWILMISSAIMFVCNIWIPFNLQALPLLLITISGIFGFGLSVAGAALVYKNISGFSDLMSTVLFYLNGSMLPIENMPITLQYVARSLPTTQGIIVLRKVLFEHQSLRALWESGELKYLILHSSLYILIGLVVFYACQRIAKRKGLLGQY